MSIAKFYFKNPNAPKPNKPNHVGVNGIIFYENRILLEKRSDTNQWGLIGGGLKIDEFLIQGLQREIKEETGIDVCSECIKFYKIYDDPSRIASYPDGNILRIISIVYLVDIFEFPDLKCSNESFDLRFFDKSEIIKLDIVESHREIIKDCLEQIMR